jgi:hypothetical protein
MGMYGHLPQAGGTGSWPPRVWPVVFEAQHPSGQQLLSLRLSSSLDPSRADETRVVIVQAVRVTSSMPLPKPSKGLLPTLPSPRWLYKALARRDAVSLVLLLFLSLCPDRVHLSKFVCIHRYQYHKDYCFTHLHHAFDSILKLFPYVPARRCLLLCFCRWRW